MFNFVCMCSLTLIWGTLLNLRLIEYKKTMKELRQIKKIQRQIDACRKCPTVCGTPVHGPPIVSKIYLLGQAPGVHEATFGRPFAYTAGKTLFRWIADHTGVQEDHFRNHVYIGAVIRCFPGKDPKKGDRVPYPEEIENCQTFIQAELDTLQPELILAIGKLAIQEVLGDKYTKKTKLVDVVGKVIKTEFLGHKIDVLCFPHPSGISIWPHSPEGKIRLKKAFQLLKKHHAWQELA